MRRSGFKSKLANGGAAAPRVRSFPTPTPGAFRSGAQVQSSVVSVPKHVALRNAELLRLAKGEPCMLAIPGVCNADPSTSVQCHSNLLAHGKGKGIKAHDCCSFSGCSSCHLWLDQNPKPSYEEKKAATMQALARQIDRWQQWRKSGGHKTMHAEWALIRLQEIHASNPDAFAKIVVDSLYVVHLELLQ